MVAYFLFFFFFARFFCYIRFDTFAWRIFSPWRWVAQNDDASFRAVLFEGPLLEDSLFLRVLSACLGSPARLDDAFGQTLILDEKVAPVRW